MLIWLDIHLSTAIGTWLSASFGVECVAMRDMGMQRTKDDAVFAAARRADAVVMTKDEDFIKLLERHGPPPRVIWLTCGNTSNAELQKMLTKAMPSALALLEVGESFVEIGNAVA